MNTPIGKLRHRITFQQESLTPDGMGGSTKTWTSLGTVSAQVEPLSGKEFFQAQQIQSSVTHKVTMRYRANTIPSLRILFGTRTFDVNAVLDPEERHIQLILLCTERKP